MPSSIGRASHEDPAKSPKLGKFGIAAWALWLYILIAVGRFGEIIPGLTDIPLAKVAISISLLDLLADKERYRSTPWARSGILGSAITIFVAAALLVPISVQTGASLHFMLSVALPIAVAFYTINRICVSWPHVRMTIFVLVLSATTLAAVAIVKGGGRISASRTYDTNDLAYVLAICVPLALGLAHATRGRQKLFLISATGLMIIATFLTQSRGGYLGLAAALLYLMVRPFSGTRKSLGKYIVLGTLMAASVYALFLTLPLEIRGRIESLGNLEADYNMNADNLTGRTSIWRRGFHAAIERPIGYGALTFQQVDNMTGGKYKAPHNIFLQITVELGFVGLFFFLRIYYLAWKSLNRLQNLAERNGLDTQQTAELNLGAISVGLRAALLASIVAGFFLSQAYASLIWTIFALVAAICTLVQNQKFRKDIPTNLVKS